MARSQSGRTRKEKLTGPYLGLGGLVAHRSRKISFVVITQATKLATTGRQNRQKPLPQTRLDPQLVLGMKAPNPHFSRKNSQLKLNLYFRSGFQTDALAGESK